MCNKSQELIDMEVNERIFPVICYQINNRKISSAHVQDIFLTVLYRSNIPVYS